MMDHVLLTHQVAEEMNFLLFLLNVCVETKNVQKVDTVGIINAKPNQNHQFALLLDLLQPHVIAVLMQILSAQLDITAGPTEIVNQIHQHAEDMKLQQLLYPVNVEVKSVHQTNTAGTMDVTILLNLNYQFVELLKFHPIAYVLD
jgi:hypothetical protein